MSANSITRRPDSRPRTVSSPSVLSGLTLWLEADAITGTANGAAIPSWADQSGAAAHAVQATGAAQPTMNTTGANGKPSVRFAGAAYMDSPALAGKPFTRVMLIKIDDITRFQTLMGGTVSTSISFLAGSGGAAGSPAAQLGIAGNGGSYAAAYCNTASNVWSVVVVSCDATGNLTCAIDGVAGNTFTGTYAFAGANPTRVGAASDATTLLIGDVAAVISYGRVLNSTERIQIDGYLRAKYLLPSVANDVQTPPTYDGVPSINHPSVLDFGVGTVWNGYRYWMAYAPFPFDSRENPSMAASNDGRTWVVPPSSSNPIIPVAEATAAGYGLNSDPSIIMNSDGVTMEMYARYATSSATLKEALIRTTSANGWASRTASQIVLSNTTTASNARLLSPSVINEGGTNRSMWVVNYTQTSLDKWVSTDSGVTWTGPTSCNMPVGIGAWWHVDVQKVSGLYYMLLCVRAPFRLRYLISPDGLNWAGTSADVIAQTGTWVDAGGFYKSCMVNQGGTSWALFATAMSHTDGYSGIWPLRQTNITLSAALRPEPPSAPSVVRGVSYVLSWTAPVATGNSVITDYKVYRNGTLLGSVGSATASYTDAAPVSGATYTVSAVNAIGEGPQSFLPSSLTNLALWLDASTISGLADGAAVSSWTDLSSGGHTATQATGANQPLYKTSVLSSQPGVRFDGVNDELRLAGVDIQPATATIFIVASKPAVGSGTWFILRLGTYAIEARSAALDNWGIYVGADVSAGAAIGTSPTRLTTVYRSTTDIDFLTNGSRVTQTSGASTATLQSPGSVGSNGGGFYSQVDIGEVLVFTRVLNTAERGQVESYLQRKWGTA